MRWALLLAACVLAARGEESKEGEDSAAWVRGGPAGALAAAVLRRAGGRAVRLAGPACAHVSDHPACLRARLLALRSAALTHAGLALDLAVPAHAGLQLAGSGVHYLGDVAPAARRHCSVRAGPARLLADLAGADVARHYAVPASLLRPHLTDRHGKYLWQGAEVENGTYTPEWCSSECATIVVPDAAEASLLASLVRRERWRASVSAARGWRALGQAACVLCAGPLSGGARGRLVLGAPACAEEYCPFETRRLVKLAAAPALLTERRAARVLANFKLTADQFAELNELADTTDESRAAETWLERHEDVARAWTAPPARQLRVIAVLPPDAGPALLAAARLAERDARAPGLEPKVEAREVRCGAPLERLLWAAAGGGAAGVAAVTCGEEAPERARALRLAARAAPRAGAAAGRWLRELGWRRAALLEEAGAAAELDGAAVLARARLAERYSPRDEPELARWARESAAAGARVAVVAAESAALVRAARRAAEAAGLAAVWMLAAEEAASEAAREGDLLLTPDWMRPDLQPDTHAADPAWLARLSALCPACPAPGARALLLYRDLSALLAAAAALLSADPHAAADLRRAAVADRLQPPAAAPAADLYQWRAGGWRPAGSVSELRWPDGLPGDGGGCGPADWMRGGCGAGAAAGAAGLLLALAGALAALYVRAKRRAERRCARRLREAALLPSGSDGADGADGWELPRSRVVINRRLGTGAFGAVYGGHALLDGVWTAVAVKTLRAGAAVEAKLEFLSEAESMKRLRHENVVRLLGVVTASEPACLVLALAALGDLRGYLLARRGPDAGAVGARRLGRWALQAARALAYLRRRRLVHRDVAARNCLLSASRTLRLADFGMARPVGDGDYYRFGRKGLLPVRWMAPESLCLGVFSPASDVWSFGVLLYEIVTFGALPFQGLGNAEVLEQVKAGRTAPLPPGLKPQLEGLIKSCWRRAREARPPASEVAAFLAEHPRLLSASLGPPPCLPDWPAPSTDWPAPSSSTDVTELSETAEGEGEPPEYDLCELLTEKER